jgi:DNA-binding NtrC family response regulator
MLSDICGGRDPADAVRRHTAATGLQALALFALPPGGEGPMEDVLEILRCCQGGQDEGQAIARVLSVVRTRLRAGGVACFASASGGAAGLRLLSLDGRRMSTEMAERVVSARQPIDLNPCDGGEEAGAPVSYDGATVGAVVARWPIGSAVDRQHVSALLATSAVALAPAVMARAAAQPAPIGLNDELLGLSKAMDDVRRSIERAAAAPYPVLVEGESGSGKELAARAIHRRSRRRDAPFCAVNCAALPDELIESELFGHARGAFTGAVTERPGVFESAHGGTLFLDEVGELSLRAQAKLLRTVQEGELRRIGENFARKIDVRILAATNRDLRAEVAAGRFRLDLLYRLDVIRIALPPLRERAEDLPLLVQHFWAEATGRLQSRATLAPATIAALARYNWPGNVRELQNVLASLAVRSPRRGIVPPSGLPSSMGVADAIESWRLDAARRTFEERFVRAALVRAGGHRTRAARELGVSRQGLTKLMARLGIATDDRLG